MTNDDDFYLSCSDLNQQISSCKYYYPDHQMFLSRPHNFLFLLHLNLRSLHKKFSALKEVLEIFPNPPKIISISETWIKADLIKKLSLPDFMFHYSPAIATNANGVATYILNKFLM